MPCVWDGEVSGRCTNDPVGVIKQNGNGETGCKKQRTDLPASKVTDTMWKAPRVKANRAFLDHCKLCPNEPWAWSQGLRDINVAGLQPCHHGEISGNDIWKHDVFGVGESQEQRGGKVRLQNDTAFSKLKWQTGVCTRLWGLGQASSTVMQTTGERAPQVPAIYCYAGGVEYSCGARWKYNTLQRFHSKKPYYFD